MSLSPHGRHAHGRAGMARAMCRRLRAFSLLELIVVLVLMGVAVGLVAPAVMRHSGAAREQRALADLAATLGAARLDAIRAGRPVPVELLHIKDALLVRNGDDDRVMTNWPLILLDEEGRDLETRSLTFDIRGRVPMERISFRSRDAPGRIWAIAFDPVGGVPTAQRHTEATDP